MPTRQFKAAWSTWVDQLAPNTPHPTATYLVLSEQSGRVARGYMNIPLNLPAGAVVSSAIASLTATAKTGVGTIGLTRVASNVANSSKTWSRQPTLGTVNGAASNTVTPAGGVTASGQQLNFDITNLVQQWVGGLANNGLQIRNSSSTRFGVYSANSAHPPIVTVTYTTPPDTPHNLMPAGVGSATHPMLTFGPYGDPDGDALQALQVQVAAASTSFGTPTWDSGTVAASDPSLDLSTTTFTGFNGTPQFWRARVEDVSGSWSAWSDPVAYSVSARPTITFASPSAATPVVNEVTPQLVFTAPGMTSFVIRVLDATTRALLAESSHITDTSPGQWGVPKNVLQPGGSYIEQVDVYDLTRSPSPGDPIYTRAELPFTFTPGTEPAPTAVGCAAGIDWPGQVLVRCTETVAPDYFTVYMDGKPVLAQVAPSDALVAGTTTTYQFSIDRCPRGTHTFQVDAVTAGVASVPSDVVTYKNVIDGVWLGDEDRKIWAMISGTGGVTQFGYKDNVTVTTPIDGSTPQQVIRGMGGLSGTFSGVMSEKVGVMSVAQRELNLLAMKALPQNTLRLVYGQKNIPVKVSNLSPIQDADSSTDNYRVAVTFDFFQCGEFPFKVNL